jgi:outer membrane protein assembly factor BamD
VKKTFYLFLFLALCLTSCATNKEEIVLSKEELYLKAKRHLLRSEFSLAAQNFEKIEETYPFTIESNKAVIMASYSHYKQKNFEESLQLIDYFRKINFDNQNLEYMYFLEILDNIGKINVSSKDVALIKNAINLMDNFIKTFSQNSVYIDYLQEHKASLTNIYIKRQLEIVDFYIFNNNLLGALNHLVEIEEKFYSEKYADELNYKFFELYRHLNYRRSMERYFKLLENNKNSKWYKYAIKR